MLPLTLSKPHSSRGQSGKVVTFLSSRKGFSGILCFPFNEEVFLAFHWCFRKPKLLRQIIYWSSRGTHHCCFQTNSPFFSLLSLHLNHGCSCWQVLIRNSLFDPLWFGHMCSAWSLSKESCKSKLSCDHEFHLLQISCPRDALCHEKNIELMWDSHNFGRKELSILSFEECTNSV